MWPVHTKLNEKQTAALKSNGGKEHISFVYTFKQMALFSCFPSQIISFDMETNKFWLAPAVLQIAFPELNLCVN